MKVTVQLPVALRAFADNREAVDLSGATVAEVMDALARTHPKLKPHLFDDQGALRRFVNVYLNDEDIRYMKRGHTPVKDGDIITVVQAVAGE